MSATLDAALFEGFFDAPLARVNVPGRQHAVEVLYTAEPQDDFMDAALCTVMQLHADVPIGAGDILVFLPGQENIEALQHSLQAREPPSSETPPAARAPPARHHAASSRARLPGPPRLARRSCAPASRAARVPAAGCVVQPSSERARPRIPARVRTAATVAPAFALPLSEADGHRPPLLHPPSPRRHRSAPAPPLLSGTPPAQARGRQRNGRERVALRAGGALPALRGAAARGADARVRARAQGPSQDRARDDHRGDVAHDPGRAVRCRHGLREDAHVRRGDGLRGGTRPTGARRAAVARSGARCRGSVGQPGGCSMGVRRGSAFCVGHAADRADSARRACGWRPTGLAGMLS